jgi:Yip1 domain
VLPTDPIRPLKDVWLRPRRVFRDLAARPVGKLDYVLAAAQGVVNFLALFRAQSAGAHTGVAEILGESFLFGPIGGVVGLFLFAAIYGRLGNRAGLTSTRNQVIHVLAYGGVPVAASLGIWVLTALLAGEATFVETPGADVEGFVILLLHVQFTAYVLLLLWSIVLQVMGFSEIQGIATRKAFWVWILGQFVGLLAAIFLSVVIATLFPGVVPH